MPETQELAVLSSAGRLDAGVVIPEAEPRGCVLLLHGIPSVNPPEPGDAGYPGLAERFAAQGYVAAWVDMRAVRHSPGYFSIEGWVEDASAAFEALTQVEGTAGKPAAIVGSSAGGAVAATMVARGSGADALVLLAAPASWVSFAGDAEGAVRRITVDAGMALAPEVLDAPDGWAAEFERVQTVEAVASVEAPMLIVHGTGDDVVPVSHASQIVAAARRAESLIIEGAGHQLRKDERAVSATLGWLGRVL